MKKYRRFAPFALALMLVPQVGSSLTDQITVPLVENRAYTVTTPSFCVTLGADNTPLGPWLKGPGKVKTPDTSDTQVDAMDAALNVFDNVTANDSIRFGRAQLSADTTATGGQYRTVASVTSPDRIVLNAVSDLDVALTSRGRDALGYSFEFRKLTCSTTSGWVPVRTWTSGNFLLIVSAFAVSPVSADYVLKCKVGLADSTAVTITSGSITEAEITAGTGVEVVGSFTSGVYGYEACELSVEPNTDGGGDSITYSVYVTYRE